MTDQPTPAPPRTWWDGDDYFYFARDGRFADLLIAAPEDVPPEGAVELVPAPDLARLRAGWALLEELDQMGSGGSMDEAIRQALDIRIRVRALLSEAVDD